MQMHQPGTTGTSRPIRCSAWASTTSTSIARHGSIPKVPIEDIVGPIAELIGVRWYGAVSLLRRLRTSFSGAGETAVPRDAWRRDVRRGA